MKADKLETEVRQLFFVARVFSLCLVPFCYYFAVPFLLLLEVIEVGVLQEA